MLFGIVVAARGSRWIYVMPALSVFRDIADTFGVTSVGIPTDSTTILETGNIREIMHQYEDSTVPRSASEDSQSPSVPPQADDNSVGTLSGIHQDLNNSPAMPVDFTLKWPAHLPQASREADQTHSEARNRYNITSRISWDPAVRSQTIPWNPLRGNSAGRDRPLPPESIPDTQLDLTQGELQILRHQQQVMSQRPYPNISNSQNVPNRVILDPQHLRALQTHLDSVMRAVENRIGEVCFQTNQDKQVGPY